MQISKYMRPSYQIPAVEEEVYVIDLSPEQDDTGAKVDINAYAKGLDDMIRNDPYRISGWAPKISLVDNGNNTATLKSIVEFENGNDAVYFALMLGLSADMPAWTAKFLPPGSSESIIQP